MEEVVSGGAGEEGELPFLIGNKAHFLGNLLFVALLWSSLNQKIFLGPFSLTSKYCAIG